MKLKLAGVVRESVVDGPGIRYVIFAQGCLHRCPGCHNQHTWDLESGEEVPVEYLLQDVFRNPLLSGVTFSGGEPFLQAGAFACLGEEVKRRGLSVVTYTGYTFEELVALDLEPVKRLLKVTDILIDGPFKLELKDPTLPFRGSSNQRLIDVPRSMREGRVVTLEV
ncbi:anaerobic ribonucleoside-triphosphate reductase activating protein [Ammonifex thiophilus]|uniref:Anaerobic ribonucleoside-triphosphate reductase-activating protein n=1 Tax=Ammonifex thiophilus TaxID=444093 RepID=A0A3D8P4P5_9THEO|nr:anaerobic ribonucleoside-triphosphate reductase activating protein [Ammonifex thiophilus]RDV82918.1 anaerobic ribonucleoside-triphosphate reductase activating protein [Ammonifex thiophilus]